MRVGRPWVMGPPGSDTPSEDAIELLDARLSHAFRWWLGCAMCGVAATAVTVALSLEVPSKWLAGATAAGFVMLGLNIGHARVLDMLLFNMERKGRRALWRLAQPTRLEPFVVVLVLLFVELFTTVL